MIQERTVGIVGAGNVGIAAAYAMFLRQTAGELILVDKDSYRAEGEAMDLMHGQPYVGNISVRAGDYPDLGRAQVVVIAAGTAQQPGEKRTDLLNRNVDVFRKIVSQLDRYAPNAVIIAASNPVDILSYAIQELSDRPSQQIIGTGTMLDTARFRSLLGSHYGVDPGSVHAYIIDRKGYTNTAIGIVIARLVEAVIEDQNRVLTVSSRFAGEYGQTDVCLSLPCVIGLNGVESKILPRLNDVELKGLEASAEFLRQNF